MKRLCPFLFIFFSSFHITTNVFAEALPNSPRSFSTFTFYLENDVFGKTDQNYTHGCGLAWISGDFKPGSEPPLLTRPFFKLLSYLGKTGDFRNISLSFRQNIYTPEDISKFEYIKNDQPYAGVTFFPIGFHEKSSRCISSLELDLGLVGPHSYAEQAQKKLHQMIDNLAPKGWNNQLHDEFVLNLNYDRRWRFLKNDINRKIGFDVLPHFGGGVGNMKTYLNSGSQFRLGWMLPNNFGSYIIQPSCECQIPSDREKARPSLKYPAFSFHIYTSFDGQLVLRDIFLDGNTFRGSHSVEKRMLVGYLTIGFALQIHRFKLDYSYIVQTKTFATEDKPHIFGGLVLSFLF